MNGEGLSDFGTGLFSGATTGAKVGDGNPYAIAAGGILGGTLSYFGGAQQRRLEAHNNANELALGDLNVSEAKRIKKANDEKQKRIILFGNLLQKYFQKQQGGA